MAKPNSIVLFLIIFFLANSMKEGYSIILCPEIEKEALLSFKHSLEDPFNSLSWWNTTTNCCNWNGVVCSNVTGNVHQLHLQDAALQGKINPRLVQLKHLKYLNLTGNNFAERIPSFIGSFTRLEYLDLSYNQFYGKIPPTIGNLSRLHSLSLENNEGSYSVDSLEWLRGLSQLERLNMNSVNLTKASGHWMQVINQLPSLVELHLSACRLNVNFGPPSDDVNITSLKILDLSWNHFESFPIPKWIFKQSNLVFLDLSWNGFSGPIPNISNTTRLQRIDLSLNHLNSTIPDWLYSCKDLEIVSTRYNSLQGSISNAIGNLTSLTILDLQDNQLSGEIPREILKLCKLQRLDLSNNMLQGEIPDMFGNMSDHFLRALTLSDNILIGNLPMSVGRLSNLEVLDIGNNMMMSGVVTESHFANLTNLIFFLASGNHLTLKLSSIWIPPFKLMVLKLGSWNLGAGSDIPSWLETQKSTMSDLDLSDTGISGNVPTWFWKMGSLNLAHNHLSGKIPDIIEPSTIYLNSNQFSGPLPRVGNSSRDINLSNNLFSGGISHFVCDQEKTYELMNLNLRGNQLTGEIPNCWMKWPYLRVMNLGDNNFSGSIPNSIGVLTSLFSLNLHNNKLSGQVPISISNCTDLVTMDLSENDLIGNIPAGLGTSLAKLRLLILRSNKLGGIIPWSICNLKSLQIFDLSNNAFSGRIPTCVNNLTAMTVKRNLSDYIGLLLYNSVLTEQNFLESVSIVTKGKETRYDTILSLVNNIDLSQNNLSGGIPEELTSLVELKSLNLSGNHLTGSIPKNIGDMKQLESLDLSRNALSGEMPNSFSAMSFLSYLNLSNNNLRGRIPESTQLGGMNASSFVGNDLCGPPLIKKCHGNVDDADEGNKEGDDESDQNEWLYVFLSLGYALGLSAFCTTLVFKKPRRAYFGLLECVWDKVYVYYHITCKNLTRQRA